MNQYCVRVEDKGTIVLLFCIFPFDYLYVKVISKTSFQERIVHSSTQIFFTFSVLYYSSNYIIFCSCQFINETSIIYSFSHYLKICFKPYKKSIEEVRVCDVIGVIVAFDAH